MNDLSWTPPKNDKNNVASVPDSDTGPQYPSLRFNGEQAAKAGLSKCEFGEEYELTIRVKATRIDASYTGLGSGDSKDKPEIQFDVIACDEPEEVESDGEESKEGEEYDRPKGKIEMGPGKEMKLSRK